MLFLGAVLAAGCASAGPEDIMVGDDVLEPDATVIPSTIDAARIDAAPIDAMPTTIDAIPIDAAPTCTVQTVQRLVNNNYDSTPVGTGWTQFPSNASYPLIDVLDGAGITEQTAPYGAWMGGFLSATDRMYQDVAIPASTTALTITGYRWVGTEETGGTFDFAYLEVLDTSGGLLSTLSTWSNASSTTAWTAFSFNVGSYAGQTIRINLRTTTDSTLNTNFFFDSLVLNVTACL